MQDRNQITCTEFICIIFSKHTSRSKRLLWTSCREIGKHMQAVTRTDWQCCSNKRCEQI